MMLILTFTLSDPSKITSLNLYFRGRSWSLETLTWPPIQRRQGMETGVIWDPRIHKKTLGLGDFDGSWDCKILHWKVGGIEVDNMVLPGSLCTGFNFKSMLEFKLLAI